MLSALPLFCYDNSSSIFPLSQYVRLSLSDSRSLSLFIKAQFVFFIPRIAVLASERARWCVRGSVVDAGRCLDRANCRGIATAPARPAFNNVYFSMYARSVCEFVQCAHKHKSGGTNRSNYQRPCIIRLFHLVPFFHLLNESPINNINVRRTFEKFNNPLPESPIETCRTAGK